MAEFEQPAIEALADAARERCRVEIAAIKASEAKLGAGWRILILLMRGWAVVFFAGGVLVSAVSIVAWGAGEPALVLKTTDSSFNARGWTIGLGFGVLLLSLSKFQSWLAKRLRARKLRELGMSNSLAHSLARL